MLRKSKNEPGSNAPADEGIEEPDHILVLPSRQFNEISQVFAGFN